MKELNKVRIDDLFWIYSIKDNIVLPVCPKHHLEMHPSLEPYGDDQYNMEDNDTKYLRCEDCPKYHILKRTYGTQQQYVRDKIKSREFKKLKVINFDDEAIPLAEGRATNKDYFVVAVLTESPKIGQRLVVYAGKKDMKDEDQDKQKVQFFIEPEIERVSFDQNNLNPSKVFLGFEAKFKNNHKWEVDNTNP